MKEPFRVGYCRCSTDQQDVEIPTGICWDNSPAESFWSTFKHERYYRSTYTTRAELVASVDNRIHRYNNHRRHSAIGMLSPVRYKQSLTVAAKAA
jgi:transposase InsO family protein